MDTANIEEFKVGIYTQEEIEYLLSTKQLMMIRAQKRPMLVGKKAMVKVNCNVGITAICDYKMELKKIESLLALSYKPDSIMDLSLINSETPIWETLIESFDGPVGYLPHYCCYDNGIDSRKLLEQIENSFERGIGFITIHPTTSRELHAIAKATRVIPSTSRGGMIVYKDMIMHKRECNIYEMIFDEILNLCQKYNVTLSIGTTYRPATIGEALDRAHLLELKKQKEFINIAKQKNVNVLLEGIGHIMLNDIEKYSKIVGTDEINVMPLGPIPTDEAIGFDHVGSAIGAAFSAYLGVANLINVVTREEHTGGIPELEAIIEGIKAAKVAARVVNLTRFDQIRSLEYNLSKLRAQKKSCVLSGGLFDYKTELSEAGCDRCANHCPLLQ